VKDLLRSLKPTVFVGSSRKDLGAFPAAVRGEIGQALFEAQLGDHPGHAKPLKGFSGVLEIRDNFDGDTYRAVYSVRFEDVLYVLHAFQKKIDERDCHSATTHRTGQAAPKGCRDHSQSQGRPMMSTKKKLPAHEKGSGNIFADLGLPHAEEHQLKAALLVQLKRLIAERKLTQTAAAKLIEMKQPDLSKLLRGDFRLISVEKLMRMLTAFDQDVEITLKPYRKRGEAGRIAFISAT
jgi:phage-related protein/predicted XRE-type DNA-binding protein